MLPVRPLVRDLRERLLSFLGLAGNGVKLPFAPGPVEARDELKHEYRQITDRG